MNNRSVGVNITAQVFFDQEDVDALINNAKANGETMSERNAILAVVYEKTDFLFSDCKERVTTVDFATLK